MVIDAQATLAAANDLIARVTKVTDKPIKYVLLTHYHAVRVLGVGLWARRPSRAPTSWNPMRRAG